MITALDLIQAASISPEHFGTNVINPNDSPEEQMASLEAYIETNALSIAKGEVSVPYRRASGGYGMPLPDAKIAARYASLTTQERADFSAELEALYDGAVLSYGRSEINKLIASNADEYDKDSDQDRIQGNQRLAKLLEAVTEIISGTGEVLPVTFSPTASLPPVSRTITRTRVW